MINMNKKIFILIFVLSLSLAQICFAQDSLRYHWIASNDYESLYFDKDTFSAKTIETVEGKYRLIDVWIKTTYSDVGAEDISQYIKKQDKDAVINNGVKFSREHLLFKNNSREFVILYEDFYDKNDNCIFHQDYVNAQKWTSIAPESRAEVIHKAVNRYDILQVLEKIRQDRKE